MVNVKVQYPYIDEEGNTYANLIKHTAEDENGNKYFILQNETEVEYSEAVDVYPCKYTYTATDKLVEEEADNG